MVLLDPWYMSPVLLVAVVTAPGPCTKFAVIVPSTMELPGVRKPDKSKEPFSVVPFATVPVRLLVTTIGVA